MDDSIYKIEQFPQDGRPWRVDLFGEVSRNDPVPSDPLIEVLMSPVRLDEARVHGIASNLAVDRSRRRSFWVNAGYLPFVRMGSVWRDGIRLDSLGLNGIERARFPGLVFGNHTMRFVPADERIGPAGLEFLLPGTAYYLGGRGLRLGFLAIDHLGITNHVLIPVMEIGRFYYFCSSELTKRLLWGKLDDNGGEIFNMEKSDPPVDGIGHVHLRMHIPDDDAWIVSRFAHSPYALSCARTIHDSLVVKKANGQTLTPDILPPFEGVTDLAVRGKWFVSGGERRFLVFWITSCSHPFPSTHLWYSRDLDGRTDGVDDPTRPEVKLPVPGRPKNKDKTTKKLRGDTEPKANLARIESFLHETRFTDLAKKARRKVDKEECRYRTAVRPPPATLPTDGWSSGDGTTGNSVAGPITIAVKGEDQDDSNECRSRPLPYPPSIKAIEQAVSHLAEMCDASFRFVQVMGEVGHGNATLFPAVCRKHPNWPYVDGRRRQALVVEINYAGTYHYVFEAERWKTDKFTTLYARDRNSQQLGDDVLVQILEYCAMNKGAWLKSEEMPHLDWRKLKHTWNSPAAFALTLVGLLTGKSITSAVASQTNVGKKPEQRTLPPHPT